MSRDHRIIRNERTGEIVLPRAQWCASYWCHFKGLQFRRHLPEDEGLLFVTNRESIVGTSIHMFNMLISIAVIWLDTSGRVVDQKLAKPWRPAYAPAKPARYYIEAHPHLLERVSIDDVLTFDELAEI
jgi:uncharacterized membrane protein (UPF0127 family)